MSHDVRCFSPTEARVGRVGRRKSLATLRAEVKASWRGWTDAGQRGGRAEGGIGLWRAFTAVRSGQTGRAE